MVTISRSAHLKVSITFQATESILCMQAKQNVFESRRGQNHEYHYGASDPKCTSLNILLQFFAPLYTIHQTVSYRVSFFPNKVFYENHVLN